jgi:meiotically up-regulated gene 157 (Mug157) protein
MDDHLFKYFRLSYFNEPHFEIDALINSVKEQGGLFFIDYHVRGFNETFYPKWVESYQYILERISEDGDFYSDTPYNIARIWKRREEGIYRESKDEY